MLIVNSHYIYKSPREDGEENIAKMNRNLLFRGNLSEAELPENVETKSSITLAQQLPDSRNDDSNAESNSNPPFSRLSTGLGLKIARLEIPRRDNVSAIFGEQQAHPPSYHFPFPDSISECRYKTAEDSFIDEEDFMVHKSNLFVEDQEEKDKIPIPKGKIMKMIHLHKRMRSYQLAYHSSTRWTTSVGPRFGCLRDYPPELQFRILEHQNLSPTIRTTTPSPRIPPLFRFSPNVTDPSPSLISKA